MRQASTRVPASAWALGLISLAPFYVTSAIYCYGPRDLAPLALLALAGWSTAMLAYLGGVRAGLELGSDHPPRWWSMWVSLLTPIAGFGLLFGALSHRFDAAWQVSGFLLAFLLIWLWDVRDIEGPAWRPRYRTLITAGAAIALAFALEQAMSL
ncbi:MAG: DUF3429 domain-containing protein [Caulobacter sp.]|nr:DUF3429 domain-containing protein [Caulobacter sp.]